MKEFVIVLNGLSKSECGSIRDFVLGIIENNEKGEVEFKYGKKVSVIKSIKPTKKDTGRYKGRW